MYTTKGCISAPACPPLFFRHGGREKDFPYGSAFLAFFLFVHTGREIALPGVDLFIAFAAGSTQITSNSLVGHFLFPFFPR